MNYVNEDGHIHLTNAQYSELLGKENLREATRLLSSSSFSYVEPVSGYNYMSIVYKISTSEFLFAFAKVRFSPAEMRNISIALVDKLFEKHPARNFRVVPIVHPKWNHVCVFIKVFN